MLVPPTVCAAPGDLLPGNLGFGASGFYRVLWPLVVASSTGNIQLHIPNAGQLYDVDTVLRYMKPDSILFHRSHTPMQIKYVELCKKKLDSVLVYTIDDWVEKTPEYSEFHAVVKQDKTFGPGTRNIIKLCDRLIVTNQLLANVYGGSHTETFVIPNYLPEYTWQQIYSTPRLARKKTKPRIGWSGAIGHSADLAILKEIAAELKDEVEWVFLCVNPPEGFTLLNCEFHSGCTSQEYPQKLYELDLDLALAPLIDNDYNKAKSSLRIVEYGACGYPVIASKVRCYMEDPHFPITLLPYSVKEWVKVIREKLGHMDTLREEGQALNKYIWENYKLEANLDEYLEVLSPDKQPFIRSQTPHTEDVDVIITTLNNFRVVQRCIDSVLKSLPSNKTKVNVLVYDDSTESETLNYLEQVKGIQLIVVPGGKGYIDKINTAFAASTNDVICLNSDTVVPDSDWIDRLKTNAYIMPRISTVTPFTNNGTIVSYPNPAGSELKPRAVGFYDDILKKMELKPVLIPTSVGFCTYFKREALDEIGMFDVHAFGVGYGEENDWCMRSHMNNWFQVVAGDVYVGHEGGATFSSKRELLQDQANKVLSIRWPNYFKGIEQYLRDNFLAGVRTALDIACVKETGLETAKAGRALFFAHSLGGGLETHLQACLKKNPSALVVRVDPQRSNIIRFEVADETYYNLPILDTRLVPPQTVYNFLKELNVKKLYVETTFGYDYNIPIFISNIANELEIPYEIMIHDYYTFCPRLRMINENMEFCGSPIFEVECENCIKIKGSPVGQVSVADWRRMYNRFIREADKVYAPSAYAKYMIARHFANVLSPDDVRQDTLRIEVIPHEDPDDLKHFSLPPKYTSGILTVAVIGFLSLDKGSLLVRECADYALKNNLPLQFLVFGELLDQTGSKMKSTRNLHITGAYEEANINDILKNSQCHISFFPAKWPETYSYTLSHAFKFGLWPIAFDIGAIAERIRSQGFGTLIPFEQRNDVESIIKLLWEQRDWQTTNGL